MLAVNKAEGMPPERAVAEFHELGLGEPLPISAAHGENVRDLIDIALDACRMPADDDAGAADAGIDAARPRRIKVAVVGRPNVGKSTLVNALLGEERVIAFDEPGTTRDAIHLDFERDDRRYTLIDTAGVRRRGKVSETVEKFSVIKTLQAIEERNVVILLLDAADGITEQDAHLAGLHPRGGARAGRRHQQVGRRGCRSSAASVKRDIERKLAFLAFAQQHCISAREGRGVEALLAAVDDAYAAAMAKLPTPRLTRALQLAVARQQPPRTGAVRPKLRYAHQGGHEPAARHHPRHRRSRHVPDAYRRYLEHYLQRRVPTAGHAA